MTFSDRSGACPNRGPLAGPFAATRNTPDGGPRSGEHSVANAEYRVRRYIPAEWDGLTAMYSNIKGASADTPATTSETTGGKEET